MTFVLLSLWDYGLHAWEHTCVRTSCIERVNELHSESSLREEGGQSEIALTSGAVLIARESMGEVLERIGAVEKSE